MPGRRGLHIPLTARLAVLAWADPANPRKLDHQDIRPGSIRWLNAASWEEAPGFVVGHPDDKAELERMTSAADVDKWGALTRGAYYGHEARRPGLFNDL